MLTRNSYLFERNRYSLGLATISSARRIAESAQEVDEILLSDLYRLEGRLCNEANLPRKGHNSFERAKAYAEKAIELGNLDAADTRIVRTLTGWGNCLNQLEQFDRALTLQLEALRACEEDSCGRHGDAIVIVKLNIGWLYLRRCDMASAERMLQETLKMDRTLEPALYALGNLYIQQDDLDRGLYLHSEALRLYAARFGEHHHCVADSLFKVGETLMKMGDLTKAMYVNFFFTRFLSQSIYAAWDSNYWRICW
jgi:tetratricopeptide (TPR) repeat protein